ncbi:MarR family winged helix-turn-helix transcriptional regulator [Microvirga sp. 2YAF29]
MSPVAKSGKKLLSTTTDLETLWREKNTGRLLVNCFMGFEQRALSEIHSAGFKTVKPSHLQLLRNLDYEGTQMAELAKRVGITKGAVTQLVASCERLGLVVIQSSPSDGRVRIVQFSREGRAMMQAAQKVFLNLEDEIQKTLSLEIYQTMRDALEVLSTSTLKPKE